MKFKYGGNLMAWKIKKKLKELFPDIHFKVRRDVDDWYTIYFQHPTKDIEDAKKALKLMNDIEVAIYGFETKNEIVLSFNCLDAHSFKLL
jgi:hypothetical protein